MEGHGRNWQLPTQGTPSSVISKDDVRGAPKGRTFAKGRRTKPKRNKGMRNRGLKQQLRLGSKGNINETFRENLGLEITKGIAGTSVMIRKISVETLWRNQPPPKRKKRRHKHSPHKKPNRDTSVGYSG
jgi:hypothetical protein